MQINEIKTSNKKARKRIGRGGKRGTYSGRGMKGQKSRSGVSIKPLFEGGRSSLMQRMKKIGGFKSVKGKKNVINLVDLEKNFSDGDKVSLESLMKKGLIRRKNAKNGVKILGNGKLTKKLEVDKHILISASALKLLKPAKKTVTKKKT